MTKESLELIPYDQGGRFCVMSLLILLPVEADPVPEERCGKRNLVRIRDSSASKKVLILLRQVVAAHVEFSAVYV